MVKCAALLAWVVGCGFHPGGPSSLGGDAGAPDARDAGGEPDAVDAGVTESCAARWLDGSVRFSAPVQLVTTIINNYNDDPFVTADQLVLYFNASGGASEDVYAATRASTGDAFGTPVIVPSLSSAADDSKVSITRDGLDAVIASELSGSAGGALDIWEATRAATDDPFGTWTQANLMNVNSAGNDFDPAISADGQHLYFAPPVDGTQHIVVAARNANGRFAAPAAIPALIDAADDPDADPTPSRDELVLVFSSLRTGPGVPMGRNMWYATRATTTAAFSVPVLVPDVNTDSSDGGPYLSDDSCTLYFASDRADSAILLWAAAVM
ncbi:MAG TPA: hypothetical protein VGF94_16435 [Kofleriaceae bacterium]